MRSGSNRVKAKLEAGGAALGLVVRTNCPAVIEMAGLAGFDYVWIDMEHGSLGYESLEQLVRAADCAGVEALVRVAEKSPSNVLRALETGASIVCIPQIESTEEAEAVARAARFHPLGQRGFTTASRGTGYGFAASTARAMADANDRVLLMVQIESARGVSAAEAICRVPGVDIIFVGLGDLSQSLGHPGELDHPAVLESVHAVLEAARRAGKVSALPAFCAADVTRWTRDGARLFYCGVDLTLMAGALKSLRASFSST